MFCEKPVLVDVVSVAHFITGHEQTQLSRVVRKPDFCICENKDAAVLRLRGSICHMRGFIFTNARKIYYHLRVSIARFLITFTGNLDILQVPCT